MPDVPLVDVADGLIAGVDAAPGGAWVVGCSCAVFGDDVGEELLVEVAGGEAGFEPVLGVGVGGVVAEVVREDGFGVLVVFVVAGPEDDAGVGVEAVDVVGCFSGDGVAEGGDLGGVVSAAEGEVLPDEDAEGVAGFIEGVFFVDAAGPDAAED